MTAASVGVWAAFNKVYYFLQTLFLFTESDIMTAVVPITVLASAAAPLDGPHRLPHVAFWLWLHLLQFDVSNQTLSPDEDAINKSHRPLPAKRISHSNAVLLRWLLIPICVLSSSAYSTHVVCASAALAVLTIVYNELGASRDHWIVRNLVNALGLASLEVGATLVAGPDPTRLDKLARRAIAASTGVLATTMHSQDFRDEAGDRAIGRRTVPIVLGNRARYTVSVPLSLWTLVLCRMWGVGAMTGAAMMALALFTGSRYVVGREGRDFQTAYFWYNVGCFSVTVAMGALMLRRSQVWLSCVHALPVYHRLHESA
ncbi:UbiA prenyltransferase family-domain-containing protein [Trametes maxima]|nr:UbiA prenyltransferase family-domain-containing protein [Trametes maxima]